VTVCDWKRHPCRHYNKHEKR